MAPQVCKGHTCPMSLLQLSAQHCLNPIWEAQSVPQGEHLDYLKANLHCKHILSCTPLHQVPKLTTCPSHHVPHIQIRMQPAPPHHLLRPSQHPEAIPHSGGLPAELPAARVTPAARPPQCPSEAPAGSRP